MTIDQAIKIKGLTGDEFLNADPDDIDEAERLSIEALKAIKHQRDAYHYYIPKRLPGETEE